MNIALIGYGKMGKTIEELALAAGDTVGLIVDPAGGEPLDKGALAGVDVAIEFTAPGSAYENVNACFDAGIPVICGTTGWADDLERARERCESEGHGMVYATNFSVGVNLFFALNKELAQRMNDQEQYKASIEETHHTEKLDAPSGTGITLAEGIVENLERVKMWVKGVADTEEALSVVSHREVDVPGTHNVKWTGPDDEIELVHSARSRKGFAGGALQAARWIQGRKGFYSMADVLGL